MRSHLQRIFQLGPPQICPTPLERLQLPALFHFQSYILCRKMKKSPENKNMVLCLLAVDPLKSTSSKLGQISTTTCILYKPNWQNYLMDMHQLYISCTFYFCLWPKTTSS